MNNIVVNPPQRTNLYDFFHLFSQQLEDVNNIVVNPPQRLLIISGSEPGGIISGVHQLGLPLPHLHTRQNKQNYSMKLVR